MGVVLDAYIIEEIKRREEARREAGGRPRLRYEPDASLPVPTDSEEEVDEAVIHIEIDQPTIRIGS